MQVKIRYNTSASSETDLQWRVIIDGVERLASDIHINCKSWTSKDYIEGIGWKWHISCEPKGISWKDNLCILN